MPHHFINECSFAGSLYNIYEYVPTTYVPTKNSRKSFYSYINNILTYIFRKRVELILICNFEI